MSKISIRTKKSVAENYKSAIKFSTFRPRNTNFNQCQFLKIYLRVLRNTLPNFKKVATKNSYHPGIKPKKKYKIASSQVIFISSGINDPEPGRKFGDSPQEKFCKFSYRCRSNGNQKLPKLPEGEGRF